jgi:hypothetical protein
MRDELDFEMDIERDEGCALWGQSVQKKRARDEY